MFLITNIYLLFIGRSLRRNQLTKKSSCVPMVFFVLIWILRLLWRCRSYDGWLIKNSNINFSLLSSSYKKIVIRIHCSTRIPRLYTNQIISFSPFVLLPSRNKFRGYFSCMDIHSMLWTPSYSWDREFYHEMAFLIIVITPNQNSPNHPSPLGALPPRPWGVSLIQKTKQSRRSTKESKD